MGFPKKAARRLKRIRPFIIIALMALACFLLGPPPPPEYSDAAGENGFSMEDVKEFFPEAGTIAPGEGVFRVKDDGGGLLGFVVYGPPEGAGIIGYAGEVPFLAGLDKQKGVKGVLLLESRETPGYARMVSEELGDAWTGLEPGEAYREPVDAVTGATQTSMALIEGVRLSMREIAEDRPNALMRSSAPLMRSAAEILVLFFLAGGLLCYFLKPRSRRVRLALAGAGVVIPGFLTASLLSLAVFESWLGGFVSWQRHWLLIIIAFFAAAAPLLLGRNFYCFYFCPFGKAQELAGKISKRKLNPGGKIYRFAAWLRLALIAAAFFAAVSGGGTNLYMFEPFSAFRWHYAPVFSRVLAVSFLVLAIRIPRPWCRICPTGGIIDGLKLGLRKSSR